MPEVAFPELLRLPAQVRLFGLAGRERAVAEELRVPFGQTEFPRHRGAAELPLAVVPPAVHRPVPRERRSVLAEEQRFGPFLGPMSEPVRQLLHRREIRIEVDRVHRPDVATGVVVDDAAWVEPVNDRLGAQSQPGVVRRPGVARVVRAVDQVGVHVLVVPRGVVAHRVEHDRGVVLRHAHVKRRVTGVPVIRFGVGRLPVVLGEVRLGKRHQHADVVGSAEDFLEAHMRARRAVVVVHIHAVDPDALQALQRLSGGLVGGRGGADLGVVQREGGQENAGAIEIEIAPVDPQLTEPEPHRQAGVEIVAGGVRE